jgi:hypothetical protein
MRITRKQAQKAVAITVVVSVVLAMLFFYTNKIDYERGFIEGVQLAVRVGGTGGSTFALAYTVRGQTFESGFNEGRNIVGGALRKDRTLLELPPRDAVSKILSGTSDLDASLINRVASHVEKMQWREGLLQQAD